MSQTIHLCTTTAEGVQTCIEQANGLLVWGSHSGTWQEGVALVLAAYISGFIVSAIRHTMLGR